MLVTPHTLAIAASYTDYARVVASKPLYERVRVPVPAQHCETGLGSHSEGWVGPTRYPGSLADHLREEIAARLRAGSPPHCTEATEYREIQRIKGYRVWYEYRGKTLVREMSQPPGPRIQVVVDLQPEN